MFSKEELSTNKKGKAIEDDGQNREQRQTLCRSTSEPPVRTGTTVPNDVVAGALSPSAGSGVGSVRVVLLVLICVAILFLTGFALGRGALPTPRDISFEAIRSAVVNLSILSVEVTGLLVILILCWKHISDLWGRK